MAYVISFSISILFLILAERTSKKGRYVVSFFAIMIPCFLAAFRADTVGTDVKTYLIPMFDIAKSSHNIADFFSDSWTQLYTVRTVASIEVGFSLLLYVVTKLFSNLYVLQFFIQFLTIFPIYIALNRLTNFSKKKIMAIGMMVYYATCYNYSLNLMRQYIAIGFLVLSFSYLIMGQKKKFFIYECVSITFHYAAIAGLIIFMIHEFILGNLIPFSFNSRLNEYNASKYRSIAVIALSILMIMSMQILVNIIVNQIGNIKYIGYINGVTKLSINQIILRLPLLTILLMNFKRMRQCYGNKVWLLSTFIILVMVVAQLVNSDGTASSGGAYRIVLYFSSVLILIVPIMYTAFRQKNIILKFLLISYFVIWWIYYFGIAEECTIPYLSIWS